MKTLEREGASHPYTAEAYARRKSAGVYAQGIFAETFPMEHYTASGLALVSGRLYLTKLDLAKGDVVSTILLRNNTAQSAATLLKFGIVALDMNGVDHRARVLGQTADVSSGFGSVGVKTVALSAPLTITDDDAYYLASLFTGTTGPALYCRLSTSVSGNGPLLSGTGYGKNFAYNLGGMTDFPANGSQFAGALSADGNNGIIYAALAA